MTIEELFKYAYVITVNEFRLKEFKKVFQYYNLPNVNIFKGILYNNYSAKGCSDSHLSLIKYAKNNNFPYILIFEDDAYPRKDIIEKLNYYLNIIPGDCGILSLGYSGYVGRFNKQKDFITFYNYKRLSGAQSYIVFNNCFDYIISALEKHPIPDQVLAINNFCKDAPIPYWTNEQLFIQKNISNQCLTKQWYPQVIDKITYIYSDKAYRMRITEMPPENFEEIL